MRQKMLWVQRNQLIFWIGEAGVMELFQGKRSDELMERNRDNIGAHIERTDSCTTIFIHFLLSHVIVGFHHVAKFVDSFERRHKCDESV